MADATVSSPAPRKRRSWLRIIGWIVIIFIVLLVGVYFVGTSAAFLKGVILPKAGKSLNATITVSDASISPFKEVVLKDLKVQTTGTEPLVSAPEVRLRYSLMDIIGGKINVDEVTLTSPTVILVQNPDGSSNLDPILNSQKGQPEKPKEPSKPSKPLQVNVKKIALTDATVRQVKLYKSGNRDTAEISHLNFNVEDVRNGGSGKLTVGADIKMDNNPPSPGTNGVLLAKLVGNFGFALEPDLKPASIQGNTKLDVNRAEGAMAQMAGLGASLDCDVTPTEIKQVALRFQKGSTPLGELRVSGPFNMEKTEGRLTVQLANIDKNLLNLAGASSGIDFGPTTINSTNEIQLANAGAAITAAGLFNLNQLQMTRTNQTSPPLDLSAQYNIGVDRNAGNAVIRAFTLNGTQKGNQFLRGELTAPMTVAWGNNANAVGDSALNITISHLNLADWNAFIGDVAPTGDVNSKLQLLSQQAGKQLTFDLDSKIDNLTAGSGSNQITQATVTLKVNGKAADFKQFDLSSYKFEIARQNQPLVTVSGAGTYNQGNQTADIQIDTQLMIARLLQALPRPEVKISAGNAELKAHLTQKGNEQNVTGSLTLSELTGSYGDYNFRSFATTANLDLGVTPSQAQIRKISGTLSEGGKPGGSFEISGTYGLSNQVAQMTAKLSDFNQNGLRPFLEPMLAEKKLVSVAINANASTQYDPQGASSVKADLQVTNLVVNDPKGQFPSTPLETRMQADVSLNKNVVDIRQFQIGLTPTARATNQVQLTGRIDMSQTNATQGSVKLAADSLDFTSYYDLFAGKKAPEKPSGPTTPPQQPARAPAPGGPEKEPEAKQLPFRNFTAEANIRRLYLHEMEIADFQTLTKIDGGAVTVNPCKLTINGAPVNTTVNLDLGVPGYKYDLAFSAQSVPLAPLVDSFQPERKGQLAGTVSAQAKVSGAGTTGASLQKSLAGSFDMGSTNLNLSVANINNKLVKGIVQAIVILPELASNPTGAALNLISQPTSTGSKTNELSKSVVDAVIARGSMGDGKVLLQQMMVQSPAFRAEANGTITLAPVLTNSTIDIPVSVYLEKGVAQRINLAAGDTQADSKYTKLPNYLTMKNTIGDPKREINKAALLGTAIQGLSGLGGKNKDLIHSLGGALAGSSGTSTNAGGTNQPGGLLQGLSGLLGGSTHASTNAPGSATNAPATNQSPVNSLLNLFGPKKK
jgi:uncharacterized protein involved in outer membrane biogenesis